MLRNSFTASSPLTMLRNSFTASVSLTIEQDAKKYYHYIFSFIKRTLMSLMSFVLPFQRTLL